jgi:hypothetical protein
MGKTLAGKGSPTLQQYLILNCHILKHISTNLNQQNAPLLHEYFIFYDA